MTAVSACRTGFRSSDVVVVCMVRLRLALTLRGHHANCEAVVKVWTSLCGARAMS